MPVEPYGGEMDLEGGWDYENRTVEPGYTHEDQAEENPRKLLRRVLKIAPDRVHTLVPGVLILHTVAQVYGGHTILTSPYGVREGYLSQMLEREEEHYA